MKFFNYFCNYLLYGNIKDVVLIIMLKDIKFGMNCYLCKNERYCVFMKFEIKFIVEWF